MFGNSNIDNGNSNDNDNGNNNDNDLNCCSYLMNIKVGLIRFFRSINYS